MKTRVITGILITLATALLIVPGYKYPILPIFFFLLVSVISLVELSGALKNKLPEVSSAMSVIASLGIFVPLINIIIRKREFELIFFKEPIISPNILDDYRLSILKNITESLAMLVAFFVIYSFFAVTILIVSKGGDKVLEAVLTVFSGIYVVFPYACAMAILFFIPNGLLWLILAIISAWITDVFAFFAGVTFGKHKIIPQISPKKTWEGTIGGVIGTTALVTVWMVFIMNGPDIVEKSKISLVAFGLVLGLLVSVISQTGDWFASIIKRRVDIKDYGFVLPGHGGIMDRFDGVLFTLPTVLVAALIYYLL